MIMKHYHRLRGIGVSPESVSRSQFTVYVLEQLRLRILRGDVPKGTRLVERLLAEEFNVSRGPIRDAFLILEQEGLVHALPRGGIEVVGLTGTDVSNFYAVRYNLEKMACESILRDENNDLSDLRAVASEMATSKNLNDISRLDVAFHHEMVRLGHNHFLLRLWETLAPVIAGILEVTNNMWEASEVIQGHEELLATLAHRNNEVFRVLQAHLVLPEKLMKRYLNRGKLSESTTETVPLPIARNKP